MTGPVVRVGGKDEPLEAALSAGLTAHNLAATAHEQAEFSVRVDDDAGLVAGLSGWTWGPVAGLSLVWVREDSRRAGWGGRLLAEAEQELRRRGCTRVFVSSFSFQAPAFYARRGYVECARVEDYPVDGAAGVHLVKDLSP